MSFRSRRRVLRTSLVLLTVVSMLVGTLAGVVATDVAYAAGSDPGRTDYSVSGDQIVWLEKDTAGVKQVHTQNQTTGTTRTLTSSSSAKDAPAVGGGIVVWADKGSEEESSLNWDIYSANVSSGIRTKLNQTSGQYGNPSTDGVGVVWYERKHYGNMIYHDLASGVEADLGEGRFPVLANGIVVYKNARNGGLSMLNLSNGATRSLVSLGGANFVDWFVFNGTQVLWKQKNGASESKYVLMTIKDFTKTPLDLTLMTEFKDASGQKTSYEYDALGRNTLIKNALGYETAYQYNALGNVEKVVDANGHETAFTYDVLGRLTEVKNAEGNITSNSYDASGNLLDKTNALGSVTSYQYDNVNQVVETTNPMMEKTSFTYDSNGNLLEEIEPDALTTSYAYNADDQLEQIMYGDGRSVKYEFDDAGRRSLMTDSTGKTRYTYDALNRPTSVIDPRGNNVRYEWTATSQRSRIIYPDNSVVTYSYDKLDRISQVTDGQDQTTSYHYDENGRLIDKLLPNAGQSTYTYDGVGQLLEMKHQAPGGALLEQLTYIYDPVGNKLSSER